MSGLLNLPIEKLDPFLQKGKAAGKVNLGFAQHGGGMCGFCATVTAWAKQDRHDLRDGQDKSTRLNPVYLRPGAEITASGRDRNSREGRPLPVEPGARYRQAYIPAGTFASGYEIYKPAKRRGLPSFARPRRDFRRSWLRLDPRQQRHCH